MPIMFVVGENDKLTTPKSIKKLHDLIEGEKEFHIVKNSKHNFRSEENLKDLKIIFINWINRVK